jgi:enoyl-CoA hydratase/carnithine racemase
MSEAGSASRPAASLERRDAIGLVSLSSLPAGALTHELIADLGRVLDELESAPVNVVVIHSTVSGTFGVGADLKLMESFTRATFVEYLTKVRGAIDRIAELPSITIAAIDGWALGGGLELALACTFRICSRSSQLGLPEIRLGLLPGAGGTQRLTRLVGRDAALDLLLSGRRLDAAEAKSLGVVSRVADTDVLDAALSMAQSYARWPPAAARAILRCVEAALPYAAAPGLQFEEREMHELFDDADARRLVREFVADRRRRAEGSQAG